MTSSCMRCKSRWYWCSIVKYNPVRWRPVLYHNSQRQPRVSECCMSSQSDQAAASPNAKSLFIGPPYNRIRLHYSKSGLKVLYIQIANLNRSSKKVLRLFLTNIHIQKVHRCQRYIFQSCYPVTIWILYILYTGIKWTPLLAPSGKSSNNH